MIHPGVWKKPTFLPVKRWVLVFLCAIVTLSSLLVLIQPSPANAAAPDAVWGAGNYTTLFYKGESYSGPKTNNGVGEDRGSGSWFGDKDAIYFQKGNTQSVISFPKGASLADTKSASVLQLEWRTVDRGSGSHYIAVKGASVSVGGDPVTVSLAEVKSVYSSSIQSFIVAECNKTLAEQSACIRNTTNRLSTCFDGQVADNNFTYNTAAPGSSIDLDNLAGCIASGSPIGNAGSFKSRLTAARDEANTAGNAAYTGAVPADGGAAGDEASSCKIDGIGWIVCPISKFMAWLTDSVFQMVSGLLEVKVFSNTTSNASLYDGWKTMRSFANVAFVIAFMVIIMSQLTSIGINNYGIKKILPRLIIAAILVNVSFWVCAIAVDLSNLLGSSLQDILMGLSKSVATASNKSIPTWEVVTTNILSGGVIGAAAIGAVFAAANPATLLALLGLIWPLLIAALFSILVTLILLTARQALIVILVIISPLAFVAFLLPNTEKWFTRWKDLLMTMLVMFPLIAMLFGGSQYAAALIMASASTPPIIILALAVQVIPLAITPFIVKLSGSLLGKFGGMLNNPAKGPFDRVKNAGSEAIKKRQDTASKRNLASDNPNFAQRLSQRQNFKNKKREVANKKYDTAADARWDERKANNEELVAMNNETNAQAARGSEAQRMQKKVYLQALGDDETLLDTAAGVGGVDAKDRILASVKAEEKNETAQAIKNAQLTAGFGPGELDKVAEAMVTAARANDTVTSQAMQNILLTSGGPGLTQYRNAMTSLDSDGDAVLKNTAYTDMRDNVLDNHWGVKASAADIVAHAAAGGTMAAASSNSGTWNLSDIELARQKPASQEVAIAANAISPVTAARLLDDPDTARELSAGIKEKFNILAGRTADATSTIVDNNVLTVNHDTPDPSKTRTSTPSNTDNYSQTNSGLFVPQSSSQPVEVKVTNQPAPSTTTPQPQVVNVVPPEVNVTNQAAPSKQVYPPVDVTPVNVTVTTAPQPPAGRRSSGAALDGGAFQPTFNNPRHSRTQDPPIN
ncbi:MAG: hypothetical protein ABIR91_00525 [Candidatus Saccharimonadales bacterium]